MSKEFVFKKLKQMIGLIRELDGFLDVSFLKFSQNCAKIRASERNFQLLVEQAGDINTHILATLEAKTPDSYWESFREIEKLRIISYKISKDLIRSAKLRNILIHEYDFDQDNFIFYKSVKKFIPIYKDYIVAIEKYYEKN